ncbi:MAG: recombinase family protein [Oscillospiraceae bacterium]|nr:recombinase family protein [Oscillospiraceae bacterium]
MNAVIYARYSSDNQREESIEGQLRECKAFANKKGLQIVGTYIDRALSAKTDNRPQFQKMIRDSAQKKFELVIVWKLDRFSRNRYDSARYKAVLKKNGVRVVSATEAISDGAEGIILEAVLEGMAEYYSADLAEKVLRGMTDNALKCKYNGGGVLVGYTIDAEQHFQIDPVVAPIVLEMFRKYADGCTIKDIVVELESKGVRTAKGNPYNYESVARMLRNRRYLGEYRFNDVLVPGGIPQIVPEELFDRVQERAKTNKAAPARHKAKEDFILTTKLYCGKCGSYMVGESGTSKTGVTHRYYKCAKAKKDHTCSKKPVKKEWIENLVIEKTKKIIWDDALLERIAERIVSLLGEEDATLAALRRQYAEAEKAIDNILDAMQQGIITSSTKERLQKLETEKEELSIQITKQEIKKPRFSKEQILYFIRQFRELDLSKTAHRRKLVDCFVNAIYLYDDKLIITYNYSRSSETIPLSEITEKENGSDFTATGSPIYRNAAISTIAAFFLYLQGFAPLSQFSYLRPRHLFLIHFLHI